VISSQTLQPEMKQHHLKPNEQWMVTPTTVTKGRGIRNDKVLVTYQTKTYNNNLHRRQSYQRISEYDKKSCK
jgi:hypothetical protein